MSQPQYCFLTHIGSPIDKEKIRLFNGTVEKRFSGYTSISPKSSDEVSYVLSKMAEQSINSGAKAILFINGHGSANLNKIKFPHCIIDTITITHHLQWLKETKPDFNCIVIIQTCFSGCFPLCCEGVLTSCKGGVETTHSLLSTAFREVLYYKETFSIKDVYDTARPHISNDYNQDSQTYKTKSAWIYDTEELAECNPTQKGDLTQLLKPIIPINLMKKTIEEHQKKPDPTMGGYQLMETLNEMTQQNYTQEDVETTMNVMFGKPIGTMMYKK